MITNDEIKTIVLNLFSPFKNKVINPTEEYSTYQKKINDSVCNENIDIIVCNPPYNRIGTN